MTMVNQNRFSVRSLVYMHHNLTEKRDLYALKLKSKMISRDEVAAINAI